MSILKEHISRKGWCSSLSENKNEKLNFYDEQTITGEEIAS